MVGESGKRHSTSRNKRHYGHSLRLPVPGHLPNELLRSVLPAVSLVYQSPVGSPGIRVAPHPLDPTLPKSTPVRGTLASSHRRHVPLTPLGLLSEAPGCHPDNTKPANNHWPRYSHPVPLFPGRLAHRRLPDARQVQRGGPPAREETRPNCPLSCQARQWGPKRNRPFRFLAEDRSLRATRLTEPRKFVLI